MVPDVARPWRRRAARGGASPHVRGDDPRQEAPRGRVSAERVCDALGGRLLDRSAVALHRPRRPGAHGARRRGTGKPYAATRDSKAGRDRLARFAPWSVRRGEPPGPVTAWLTN